jgi:hypothetical protein
VTHVALAVTTARDTLTHSLAADPGAVSIESLTIAADALPHHFIARAVIFDLAPDQMVPAIVATEDAIRTQYPHFRRTGWRGASDGLRLYFTAWTAR